MHADSDGQKREIGVSVSSVARFFLGGGSYKLLSNGPCRTDDEDGHFV